MPRSMLLSFEAERTAASRALDRKPVDFGMAGSKLTNSPFRPDFQIRLHGRPAVTGSCALRGTWTPSGPPGVSMGTISLSASTL